MSTSAAPYSKVSMSFRTAVNVPSSSNTLLVLSDAFVCDSAQTIVGGLASYYDLSGGNDGLGSISKQVIFKNNRTIRYIFTLILMNTMPI